jgi:dsDNA-specific endonuclease/ATPase MutS2
VTEPVATEQAEQPPLPGTPSPADLAAKAAQELKVEEEEKPARSPEDLQAEIQKLRKENASWRTKYREAEPIVKAHQEAEEASKTEVQRLQEALQKEQQGRTDIETGYTRLELAVQFSIPPDDIDLIGSGTREEMEARAARLGALHASAEKKPPPPSDRPVEGLRPGATPEPPQPVDNSYPANWGFTPQRQS